MPFIDEAKLAPYLALKLEAEDLRITSVWKNLEGWSLETYSLGLSYTRAGREEHREIIIRKEPEAGLHDENYDVSIEYRVLTALNKTRVAVPKTLWMEHDPAPLGRSFYVMEKVAGDVPFPPAVSFDPEYRLFEDDAVRMQVAEDFIQNLAAIHNADWKSLDLDFLGEPGPGTGCAQMEVDFWSRRIERAGFAYKPALAYARNWLMSNLVQSDRACLLHGDYRSGNYIVRDGRIAAILDWELVHIGDPLSDIAYVLSVWRSAPPDKWISYLLPEEEFIARYEQASGIKVDQDKLKFYRMLFKYKSVGMSCTAAHAFKNKTELDLKTGAFCMMQCLTIMDLIKEFQRNHSPEKVVDLW